MKLEVGMYVRTKDGHIDKIIKIDNKALNGRTIQVKKGELDCCMGYEDFTDLFNSSHYEKASFNIIDILEENDYVNGKKIINVIPEDICGDEILDNQHIFTKDGEIFENEIKSIITHEQMEQMAYKVGE